MTKCKYWLLKISKITSIDRNSIIIKSKEFILLSKKMALELKPLTTNIHKNLETKDINSFIYQSQVISTVMLYKYYLFTLLKYVKLLFIITSDLPVRLTTLIEIPNSIQKRQPLKAIIKRNLYPKSNYPFD